jgi:hypothetical protein
MVKDMHQLPDNMAEALHKTLIFAFQLCQRPRSWHRPLRSMSLQKTQRLDITKG